MESGYKLTEKEIESFKHGTPEHARIMAALEFVFGFSWCAVTAFIVWGLLHDLKKGDSIDLGLKCFFFLLGLCILFVFCVRLIDKRNSKLYHALKRGEYELRVLKITEKDFRTIGSGGTKIRVYFYKCSGVDGEIMPFSQKQYKKSQVGDTVKVVIVRQLHVAYGILGLSEE